MGSRDQRPQADCGAQTAGRGAGTRPERRRTIKVGESSLTYHNRDLQLQHELSELCDSSDSKALSSGMEI